MLRALQLAEPWKHDPDVLPVSRWRHFEGVGPVVNKRPLSFGIMEDDGVVMPHPPITRAVRMVKEALEAKGHKVNIEKRR